MVAKTHVWVRLQHQILLCVISHEAVGMPHFRASWLGRVSAFLYPFLSLLKGFPLLFQPFAIFYYLVSSWLSVPEMLAFMFCLFVVDVLIIDRVDI